MKRNFVLLTLGDKDFSEHLRFALQGMQNSLDLQDISELRLKDYVVSHMVATEIRKKSLVNDEQIDWDKAKTTPRYLNQRLEVSFPNAIDRSKHYDSGAAYLDINLRTAFVLKNA